MAASRVRAERLRQRRAELEEAARRTSAEAPTSLATALTGQWVAVIAEVKRRSPSAGAIDLGIAAADQAAAYVAGGAAAISVLTEPDRFAGRPEDLSEVRRRVAVPLLRKDFHVDPLQLVEARALGASAVLLIVRALEPSSLRELIDCGTSLGLDALVEIHTEAEGDQALRAGARIIGVNNRDLETLAVDPHLALRIIPRLPPSPSVIAVAESGIAERGQVEAAARAGADAVLVGTAASAASDPAALVSSLGGVRRDTGRRRGV